MAEVAYQGTADSELHNTHTQGALPVEPVALPFVVLGGHMIRAIRLLFAARAMRIAAARLDAAVHGQPVELSALPEGRAFIAAYTHYLQIRRGN
jgi:hypothetical protein